MAAETLTGLRAARTFPAQGAGWASAPVTVWGHYAIAANVEDGDIFELCKTPTQGSGFLLLGGWVSADDMDSGTEALDMDLGWAANGSASAATIKTAWGQSFTDSGNAASATGLGNFGVWSGDAITDLMPAGTNYRPLVLPTPLWFAIPTKIQLEANVAAATFVAGDVTVTLIGNLL
jgi:hypothetical protein